MKVNYSRRDVLQVGAAAFLVVGSGVLSKSVLADEPYADPEAADRWLLQILNEPGAVGGALHMGRFRDRMYWLLKEIRWSPGSGQEGPTVSVPAGFVTDLTSIPRIFWTLLPTDGVYTFPAIVHDYLYWTQNYPRETADKILLYGMNDMNVSDATAHAIYLAVRAGGGVAWSNNARLKEDGECRLLRQFPDDPRISWSDWKQRPDTCSTI